MGRRPSFELAKRKWIADQLLHNHHAVRSREVWGALYSAFLEQFPDAQDVHGESITLERYKSHVLYVERMQETDQVGRALAHLQRHKLHNQDHQVVAQKRKRPLPKNDVGSCEDFVIKNERVEQQNGVADEAQHIEVDAAPRPPAPLLRTRATASAIRAGQNQQPDTTDPLTVPPTATLTTITPKRPQIGRTKVAVAAKAATGSVEASFAKSAAVSEAPTKRVRKATSTAVKLQSLPPSISANSIITTAASSVRQQSQVSTKEPLTREMMVYEALEQAERQAEEWAAKYAVEKATNTTLQSRLSEALALLKTHEKQLQREDVDSHAPSVALSASTLSSSANPSALTFTVSVNVDVLHNGQRLRTTNHALQVDADVSPLA